MSGPQDILLHHATETARNITVLGQRCVTVTLVTSELSHILDYVTFPASSLHPWLLLCLITRCAVLPAR